MGRVAGMFVKSVVMVSLLLMPAVLVAADVSGQLVISGSDTAEPVVLELAKGFMASNKGSKITVRGGGSGKGVSDVRSGGASIGMVSRALTSQESIDLRAYTIAYDGICFVTSKKNPVQSLNPAQLEGVFTGRITNWKDVGGPNLPINAVIRDRLSSSNKVVAEFLGIRDTDLRGSAVNDADIAMRSASTDTKTIAFVSSGEAFHDKLAGLPINILSISGKKPSLKAIAQNSYPLTRPLALITKGEASPLAKAFIGYAQSKAAAPTMRAHSFVMPE